MLFNKTRNQKIIGKTELADSHWKKLKGLMFEDFKNFDYALIFLLESESQLDSTIHMMFVFFEIDVVYLDKNKKVVDIARKLKPFALSYTPKKPAKYFIELPEGTAKNISIGDELEWNQNS